MTDAERGWVVGFLEGEGCFPKNGFVMQATQKDLWPLERIREICGGTVYMNDRRRGYSMWGLGGNEGRAILREIYPFLSPRRQNQAAHNLVDVRSSKTAKDATHCIHGHPLSGDNLYVWLKPNGRKQRQCKLCGKQRNLKWRARVALAQRG